ncbi:MAG: DUF2892 domain-containing protein [Deltaproteobacteria bacterium]
MKRNVGDTEQVIRVTLGMLIILAGLYYKSWWGIIGLLPIATGMIRYCPISAILGVSTSRINQD